MTYETDKRFCALVDVLVANVRDQLEDMQMAMNLAKRGAGRGATAVEGAPLAFPGAVAAQPVLPSFDVQPPSFYAPPKPSGSRERSAELDDTDRDEDEEQLEIF